MSQSPTLISKADYLAFTTAWKELPQMTNLNQYFQIPGKHPSTPVYGLTFSASTVKALLSTVGITKVRARFCIENGHFNIILFATDELGLLSAYYLGTPSSIPYQGKGADGNIPRWLARDWIGNWANYLSTPGSIITTQALFLTKYGVLNGYTFRIEEFMEALFKGTDPNQEPPSIVLHFSLHNYYPKDIIDIDRPVNTFDLVLQQSQSENSNNDDDDKPFYDISTPCPPICGNDDE